jgi:hypothetical protein
VPEFCAGTAHGTASLLSSQFPSTTTAHLTTLHTGLPVYETGVFEWRYYEPLIDASVSPLKFSFGEDLYERETLARAGVRPSDFLPQRTVYQELLRSGVRSTVYQYSSYAHSSYSKAIIDGAELVGFPNLEYAMEDCVARVSKQEGPHYYVLYHDQPDTVSHHWGPDAPATREVLTRLLETVAKRLGQGLAQSGREVLLLITADHGQVPLDPGTIFFVNEEVPALNGWVERTRSGRAKGPAGSPRDLFLYLRPAVRDEAVAQLRAVIGERGAVYPIETVVEAGAFGPRPSKRLLERLGNVVILPPPGQGAWWYEAGRIEYAFRGHHGGLSSREMEIPLLVVPLGS